MTGGGHRRFEKAALPVTSNAGTDLCPRRSRWGATTRRRFRQPIAHQWRLHPASKLARGAPVTGKSVIEKLDDVLTKALWQIGERWQARELEIYQERIATNTARIGLGLLKEKIPQSSGVRYTAIGGTISGNYDDLASKMVEVALRFLPVNAINLGANLPAKAIANATSTLNASLVWVCHTHVTDLYSTVQWHHQLAELLPTRVRVVVGGAVLSPSIAHSFSNVEYYPNLKSFIDSERKRLKTSVPLLSAE